MSLRRTFLRKSDCQWRGYSAFSPPNPRYFASFIFTGLGHLMEQLLITNARYLRLVNKNGIKKLIRNMLALQQSVKVAAFGPQNTAFERAKIYYSMYSMPPDVGSPHKFTSWS